MPVSWMIEPRCRKPAGGLVGSGTRRSEGPWAAALPSAACPVLPSGALTLLPTPTPAHGLCCSLRKAQSELVTPGIMWQECASYGWALVPRSSLPCACAAREHTLEGAVPWPPRALWGAPPQFMRGFWVQEGISSLREACRSCSCHSADMSFSDNLGSQGQFRLHILKLQMEAKLAAWKWRPVMLRDLSKILSVCAHSHDLHVQRGA